MTNGCLHVLCDRSFSLNSRIPTLGQLQNYATSLIFDSYKSVFFSLQSRHCFDPTLFDSVTYYISTTRYEINKIKGIPSSIVLVLWGLVRWLGIFVSPMLVIFDCCVGESVSVLILLSSSDMRDVSAVRSRRRLLSFSAKNEKFEN